VLVKFCTSTIGKKYLMGFSGLVWTGFVLTHMAGNLLIFVGKDAYNSYGHAITSGMLIYAVESLLLLTIFIHVFLGVNLAIKNWRSRPTHYAQSGHRDKGASLSSKTMIYQGTIILAFIILHLITFKYGQDIRTTVNGVEMRDLFQLMVNVFSQPGYVAWYIVALVLIAMHLRHGVSSVFQSFGLLHPAYQKMIKYFGFAYSVVVAAGFIAQPVYIFFFYNK
jgi:succinate dehydrogenase / fumarate reductase cytochrome b subunit